MDSFNLDKLQKLCEDGQWKEAEDEAQEIAWICRRNHDILHPRFYLRKAPPCYSQPSHRIQGVLCRLSRHRVIERADAYALACRMASKWSGNSGNTMRAFSHLTSPDCPGRYWRGDFRWDRFEDYGTLTKLARENRWQWCDLRRHAQQMRDRKQHELAVRHVDLIETREALRDLNRAIRETRVAA